MLDVNCKHNGKGDTMRRVCEVIIVLGLLGGVCGCTSFSTKGQRDITNHEVKEETMVAQQDPIQQAPLELAIVRRNPLRSLPICRLEGFMDQDIGDLGGKRIRDLIDESIVIKAVVLRNNTSMPAGGHLSSIFRVLDENPRILPLWEKDDRTGALRRVDKFDSSRAFFAALLETAKGEFVGFLLDRDAIRIVTKDGDGYVSRK